MVRIIDYIDLMIVCSCNRITEKELRAVARAGATSPESAYACFGAEPQCCCCLDYAQEIIDEARSTAKRPRLQVVRNEAA